MWPFRKPERDPTITELLTRIIELESEWRAFLTNQTRYAARMAKRDRDALLARDPASAPAPGPEDAKAALRQRAFALRHPSYRGESAK